MITSFLLTLIYNVINLIITPIREAAVVTLDSNIGTAIATASNYLANINQVFPATTLLTVFSLFLSIEFLIFSYKIVMWIIRKIPGIN